MFNIYIRSISSYKYTYFFFLVFYTIKQKKRKFWLIQTNSSTLDI